MMSKHTASLVYLWPDVIEWDPNNIDSVKDVERSLPGAPQFPGQRTHLSSRVSELLNSGNRPKPWMPDWMPPSCVEYNKAYDQAFTEFLELQGYVVEEVG